MPSNHLILHNALQSFPASGSSLRNKFFTSGGQTFGASASASVLPKNYGLFLYILWIHTRSSSITQKEGMQVHYYYNNKEDRVTQNLEVGQLLYPLSSWLTHTADEKSSQLAGIRIQTCLNNMDSLSPRLIQYCKWFTSTLLPPNDQYINMHEAMQNTISLHCVCVCVCVCVPLHQRRFVATWGSV